MFLNQLQFKNWNRLCYGTILAYIFCDFAIFKYYTKNEGKIFILINTYRLNQ